MRTSGRTNNTVGFDAESELKKLRARKQRKRRLSKLDQYRDEILALRAAGGSSTEIAKYLRDAHGISPWHTTVLRYLKRHETK